MTDPGSQRSKRMPQNCPAEIADEKPSKRQFLDLKLIDHDPKVGHTPQTAYNALSRTEAQTLHLWHHRLGHTNSENIRKMESEKLVD
jgi:hypothetical protein